MKKPIIFAICGIKNSGKTTLINKMIPIFKSDGFKIAIIKHDGHDFEADPIGTDTGSYMQSGADGSAVFSRKKFKLIRNEQVTEDLLISAFSNMDIIILEGFKNSSWPKIEIVRSALSDKLSCRTDNLFGIVSDIEIMHPNTPWIQLNDTQGIVDLIYKRFYNEK